MSEPASYPEHEAVARLAARLPRWTVEDGHLCRHFAADGWRASMLVANGIAHLAEVAWHHPELHVAWSGVTVRLRTHSADAITDRDFELAAMIEQTVMWRPGEGATLEGAPTEGHWRYLVGDR